MKKRTARFHIRHIFLFLTAVCTVCMLAGCADLSVRYEIDQNNQVSCEYHLLVDLNQMDGQDTLSVDSLSSYITSYWENQGMEVHSESEDGILSFYGRKIFTASSPEEAFSTLKSWLTDQKTSPFSSLTFDMSTSAYSREYHLDGTVDISNLFLFGEDTNLPKDILIKLSDFTYESSYTLDIVLPGEISSTSSAEKSPTHFSISPSEENHIALSTQWEDTEAKQTAAAVEWLLYAIPVLVVIIAVFLLAAWKRRKKKKTSLMK